MKPNPLLFSLLALALLAGCASQDASPAPGPDPYAGLTKDQKIEKIQSDPKMPDGLKRIKAETLQAQPGG